MSHPVSSSPPIPSPDLYVWTRPDHRPLAGCVALGFLWCAVALTVQTLRGESPPSPPEVQEQVDVGMYVFAAALALAGLWFAARYRRVGPIRFEVGRDGIRWSEIVLPWSEIMAVRVVKYGTGGHYAGEVVGVTLEVRLQDPRLAESRHRSLRRRRTAATAADGYTHHFPVETDRASLRKDLEQPAPKLQAVLARFAPHVYRGLAVLGAGRSPATGSGADRDAA